MLAEADGLAHRLGVRRDARLGLPLVDELVEDAVERRVQDLPFSLAIFSMSATYAPACVST